VASRRGRQAQLEETLRIVQPLLRGETVSFRGEYVRADSVVLDPPPVQQPYVPLIVGGGGERTTLRYVAEYADACNLGAVGAASGVFTPEDIARKFRVLGERCREAGRPEEAVLRTTLVLVVLGESGEAAQVKLDALPAPFMAFLGHLPIVGRPDEATAQVQTLLGAGFQYLIFIVMDQETLRLLGEQVMPVFAAA
jgi:alkanesulfonate monooxygenase SsuD/methylene tetrahydromethanopterin reductase-like flavin-dependent oxidoreductase (luciferase family)